MINTKNMKQEYQDIIDSYLLSRMTKEEMTAFENQIEQDFELKEQYEYTKNVRLAISSRNEKSKLLADWEKQYKKEKSSNKNKIIKFSSKKIYYWVSGVAALLVVGFFVFNNNELTEDSNLMISQNHVIVRSDSNYDSIIKELENKEYSNALSLIESEEKRLHTEDLEVNNPSQIIDEEELLYKKEVIGLRTHELLWLKIQALIGLGKKEDAISNLEILRSSEGVLKNQADSLYNILINK